MDIGSGKGYPSSSLSNFSPHQFQIDGILCNSMEGFLQSLKFSNPEMQKYVCTLVGREAKFKGKRKNWWKDQTLYWQGKEIKRESREYKNLIFKAYLCLSKNASFSKALLATGDSSLTHSMGKNDPTRTVLTENEFCAILIKIREILRNQK